MTSVVIEVEKCEKFIYFSSLSVAEEGLLTSVQEINLSAENTARKHK